MQLVLPYIRLMRPANIITAFADILAGVAIVTAGLSAFSYSSLLLLLASSAGLYGGGVVFNDYFDADLDQKERPERPIPSGRATRKNAFFLGAALFGTGIILSLMVNVTAGVLAVFISFFAVLYDAKTKHNDLAGPLSMGLCRGLNLLLGMSLLPSLMFQNWYLSFIPVFYIAAITSMSKGEVHGSGRQPLILTACLYLLIFAVILFVGIVSTEKFLELFPFMLLLAAMIFPPLVSAIKHPAAREIRAAVKSGILALIVLDATLAALFAGFFYGIVVLMLLPISLFTAKFFAVT